MSGSDCPNRTDVAREAVSNLYPDSLLSEAQTGYHSSIYQPIDAQALFASSERSALLAEDDVRNIVSEAVNERRASNTDFPEASPADELQDKRLSELDRALKNFQTKAAAKTYPNVTVNGVFQADAGSPLWHDVTPITFDPESGEPEGVRSIFGLDIRLA